MLLPLILFERDIQILPKKSDKKFPNPYRCCIILKCFIIFPDSSSKMDEGEDDLLPEDDSIFRNISNRSDNVSSDALIEDPSFSAFALPAGCSSSTPLTEKCRKRKCTPTPCESHSPSEAAGESSGDSPRTSPRLASKDSPIRRLRTEPTESREPAVTSARGSPRVASRGRGGQGC